MQDPQHCISLVREALAQTLGMVADAGFGNFNEATLQHHLAFNLHLHALFAYQHDISIELEKKVARDRGFPKKRRKTANIDLFFRLPDDGTRCAVELKYFHRTYHREPNNRYDVYADLANLEVYLENHADVGVFILVTDHPHYYDPKLKELSAQTSAFNTRHGHRYKAGEELIYDTRKPYGAPLTLAKDYLFDWQGDAEKPVRSLIMTIQD